MREAFISQSPENIETPETSKKTLDTIYSTEQFVAKQTSLGSQAVAAVSKLENQNATLPSNENVEKVAHSIILQPEQSEKQVKQKFTELEEDVYKIEGTLTLEDIETINQMKNKTTIILENTKGLSSEALKAINSETVFFSIKGGLDPEKKKKFDTEKYQERTMLSPKGLEKVVGYFEQVEKNINPNWTDLQKAMYVYNCLATDIDYDYETKDDNIETDFGNELGRDTILRSLNGVLYGKLTCAGYALTMKEMMDRVGVEAHYCNQKDTHGYNVICCDGKYYGIDVTWDSEKKQHNGGKCGFSQFGIDADFYSKYGHWNYREEEDWNWDNEESEGEAVTKRIFDEDETRFDISTLSEDELRQNLSVISATIASRKGGSLSGFTEQPKEIRAKYLPIDTVRMNIVNTANIEYEDYMVVINCLRDVGEFDANDELLSITQPRRAYIADIADKYGRKSSFGQDEISRLERIRSQERFGEAVDGAEKQYLIDNLKAQLAEQIDNYLDGLLNSMGDIFFAYNPKSDMDTNRHAVQTDLYTKMATVLNAKDYLVKKGYNESTINKICEKISQKLDEKRPHHETTNEELRENSLDYLGAVFSNDNLDVVKGEIENIIGAELSNDEFRQKLSDPNSLLETVYPNLLEQYHITKEDFANIINKLSPN